MMRKIVDWLNGRGRSLAPAPSSSPNYPVYEDDLPVQIPLENTAFEDHIEAILQCAQEQAEGLESGTEFTITAQYPPRQHPMVVIAPLMMRAGDYGLMCNIVMDDRVTFTKL